MPNTDRIIAHYARLTALEGDIVVPAESGWWRKVRPFFYRPLLPLQPLPPDCPPPALPARLGGFQYLVAAGSRHNSTLSFLLFPDPAAYSLAALPAKRRGEVRAADRHFTLRPLQDLAAFQRHAYPVYVDFYRRTHYDYFTHRLDRGIFNRWAEMLFSSTDAAITGAFSAAGLEAVSIARTIDDTVYYHSFFGHTQALKQHVASLMLHQVRSQAALLPGITQVFAGTKKSGASASVDAFYLHRGAHIVPRPAMLRLSLPSRWLLRWLTPRLLQQLVGDPA